MSEIEAPPAPARRPMPRKPKGDSIRGRKYLTEDEVESMRRASLARGRHGHRDATMILVAYTHGLRVSELVGLRWDQVDLKSKSVYIRRSKGSCSGTHPLRDVEVKALKKLDGERRGPVFRSERGGPMSDANVRKMIAAAGRDAGICFPVNPHALRHGCGYRLTNSGHDIRVIQDWLGHRNIQHTVEYTKLAPDRFKRQRFWED